VAKQLPIGLPVSTIARSQQVWTVLTWGVSLGLAWALMARDGWLAVAVAFAWLANHAWVLALEFLLLPVLSKGDPAPRPGVMSLLGAWIAETHHAWRVFSWRQPFRWRACPDRVAGEGVVGRRGVVLVHGFLCNRGFWTPWLRRLEADRRAFVAVNLEPPLTSIDAYAQQIDAAIAQVHQATGLPPRVVCHSMGGLAVRSWLAQRTTEGEAVADRVERVVTIGSPHFGTWLARWSPTRNGRQMRRGSDWLQQLDTTRCAGLAGLAPERFICWYSNTDNIVLPASSATLPGADNRLVEGAGHVDLAFREEVIKMTLDGLDASPEDVLRAG
jgi:hypothetical protein